MTLAYNLQTDETKPINLPIGLWPAARSSPPHDETDGRTACEPIVGVGYDPTKLALQRGITRRRFRYECVATTEKPLTFLGGVGEFQHNTPPLTCLTLGASSGGTINALTIAGHGGGTVNTLTLGGSSPSVTNGFTIVGVSGGGTINTTISGTGAGDQIIDTLIFARTGGKNADAFEVFRVLEQPDAFAGYARYASPNWDGFGAEPIDADTLSAARSFMSAVPSTFGAPDIAPGADGTVGLEWAFSNRALRKLFIDIGPGWHWSGFWRKASGEHASLARQPITPRTQAELAELFKVLEA